MSKPIIWIIILTGGVGIAGGTYYYFSADKLRPPVVVQQLDPATSVSPLTAKPTPDHGTFQKRFQPSMPAGK